MGMVRGYDETHYYPWCPGRCRQGPGPRHSASEPLAYSLISSLGDRAAGSFGVGIVTLHDGVVFRTHGLRFPVVIAPFGVRLGSPFLLRPESALASNTRAFSAANVILPVLFGEERTCFDVNTDSRRLFYNMQKVPTLVVSGES